MIIAIKRDGKVVVGISICDCSIDMTESDLALADNLPFLKVKGEKDCYVCTEDLTYSTDLLRYNDYVFKGISDGRSVIEKVLPRMKELLGKHNRLVNDKEWHNQMLIIKGDRIFRITNYLCVSEIDEYTVMGYESYIQGTLDETRDIAPEESILSAVRNVNRMRNRQFFPITVFDSKSKRKKVYYQ